MAYTDVKIVNLALRRCSGPTITSFTDNSEAARVATDIFDHARCATLEARDWAFARKEAPLTEMSNIDAISGNPIWQQWGHAYELPPDCLTVRYIYNAYQSVPNCFYADYYSSYNDRIPVRNIPFETRIQNDETQKVLLTDMTQAIAIYTGKVTNSALYDAMFVDALVSRLAAEFSQTILIDAQRYATQMQVWKSLTADASENNANEAVEYPVTTNTFVAART